jgi:hypothetical protein
MGVEALDLWLLFPCLIADIYCSLSAGCIVFLIPRFARRISGDNICDRRVPEQVASNGGRLA